MNGLNPAGRMTNTLNPRYAIARIGTIFLILAYYTALVYSLDPSDTSWGAGSMPPVKYLPIVLAVCSWMLLVLGSNAPRNYTINIEKIAVFALFVFMLIGSAYTVFSEGVALEDSFIGRSLGLLVFFPAYKVFINEREKAFLLRLILPGAILAGMAMFSMVFTWVFFWHFIYAPQIFHEEIFLSVNTAVILWYYRSKFPPAVMLSLIIVIGGVLTVKNTGILVSIVTLSVILAITYDGVRNSSMAIRHFLKFVIIFSILAIATVIVIIALEYSELIPSGSVEVRYLTYLQRLDMFFSNPFIGSAFTGSPLMDVSFLRIPSHSDIIDILAFGGLIGFFLFIVIVWNCGLSQTKLIMKITNGGDWSAAYFLVMFLSFIVEMMFNPVWGQPKLAFFFWMSAGYLSVVRSRARRVCRGDGRRRRVSRA